MSRTLDLLRRTGALLRDTAALWLEYAQRTVTRSRQLGPAVIDLTTRTSHTTTVPAGAGITWAPSCVDVITSATTVPLQGDLLLLPAGLYRVTVAAYVPSDAWLPPCRWRATAYLVKSTTDPARTARA